MTIYESLNSSLSSPTRISSVTTTTPIQLQRDINNSISLRTFSLQRNRARILLNKLLNKRVDYEELEYEVSSINKSPIRRAIRGAIRDTTRDATRDAIRGAKKSTIKSTIKRYRSN